MKIKYLIIIAITSLISISVHFYSRNEVLESKVTEMEITIKNFKEIVEEQDSIKREKEAELKLFEDIIKDAFKIHGFENLEFNKTDYSPENSITTEMDNNLIKIGWVRKVKFLYTSMLGYDVYEWELTSTGKKHVLETAKEWDKNTSRYEYLWSFDLGKCKFNKVTKVVYLNPNQAKVTYETKQLSLTDYTDKDNFVGKITQHDLEFYKKESKWELVDSDPFTSRWR